MVNVNMAFRDSNNIFYQIYVKKKYVECLYEYFHFLVIKENANLKKNSIYINELVNLGFRALLMHS